MNRNKLFQKLYSVIMAVILLAQLLTPIAQIDANDQVCQRRCENVVFCRLKNAVFYR
ncbi:hypothetical protein [Liquorilactobacillus satsumensis]|uniref:hypothetical protein n=1 Tax=Liquorilactobacillus TaxID=2767888 RepID=UPI001E54D1B5|nr:hypothetical protein [Liquorilactobacillus satsumensis]